MNIEPLHHLPVPILSKHKLKTKKKLDHLRSIAEANTIEEIISEHPRGNRGVQVGALGCER